MKRILGGVLGVGLAAMMLTAAAPAAHADEWRGRDDGYRHEQVERDMRLRRAHWLREQQQRRELERRRAWERWRWEHRYDYGRW